MIKIVQIYENNSNTIVSQINHCEKSDNMNLNKVMNYENPRQTSCTELFTFSNLITLFLKKLNSIILLVFVIPTS